MKERVLVTGGAGFIGSHTVDLLLRRGYSVVVLDDLSTGNRKNIPKDVTIKTVNIWDYGLESLMREQNIDYVINLAAQINVRNSIEDPRRDADVNIIGLVSLLNACVAHGVKKVVHASSGGTVYGKPRKIPVKETARLRPLSPYGISKMAGEHYLDFFRREHGLEYTVLRYANVYGPRQNPKGESGVISVFIGQMLKGKTPCIWGDGTQTRDFVFVEDVADANLKALQLNTKNHVFNIGSNREISVNDIYDHLAAMLKGKEPKHDPRYQEAIPRIALDCTLAYEVLGWEARTPLYQGLKKTIEWFR